VHKRDNLYYRRHAFIGFMLLDVVAPTTSAL